MRSGDAGMHGEAHVGLGLMFGRGALIWLLKTCPRNFGPHLSLHPPGAMSTPTHMLYAIYLNIYVHKVMVR
jgi:hypothetical protein